MLSTYEEMSEKASRFYEGLQIKIPEQYVDLAVRSLTMPQYAKEYNDSNNHPIGDHRALATVGDAVCGAFLMLDRYRCKKCGKVYTMENRSRCIRKK